MPSEVATDEVLRVLARDPKWMALSLAPAGEQVVEPGPGYQRAPVVSSDWDGGQIAPKDFGPARQPWDVASVVLLSAAGDPLWWVSERSRVLSGQRFTYEMTVEVS